RFKRETGSSREVRGNAARVFVACRPREIRKAPARGAMPDVRTNRAKRDHETPVTKLHELTRSSDSWSVAHGQMSRHSAEPQLHRRESACRSGLRGKGFFGGLKLSARSTSPPLGLPDSWGRLQGRSTGS